MTTEITPCEGKGDNVNVRVQGGSSGAVYGLGSHRGMHLLYEPCCHTRAESPGIL